REKSLHPVEEAVRLSFGSCRRGFHNRIKMNLPLRRVGNWQLGCSLHRRRRNGGTILGAEHKRRIDLDMNLIRLRRRQRRSFSSQTIAEDVLPINARTQVLPCASALTA